MKYLIGACLCVLLTATLHGRVLDGGVDPANLGKGEWLWQLSNCTNKMKGQVPTVVNIPTMMDFLKSKGIQYIIVKAGSGSTNFPSSSNRQFNTALVTAAHAAGIKIFGYTRSWGIDIAGESAIADYVFNCGADGFVLDAEAEWESNKAWIGSNGPTLAMQLCGMIKTNWPNKFLGHAPFPIISGHSSFPYKEFGYWCDAVLPQVYYHYWNKTATAGLNWMDTEWRSFQNGLSGKWTNAIKPLAPIADSDTSTQDVPSIAEFYNYLKTDPNCVTATGYKGCSFWDAEEHYATTWDAIGAGSIGDIAPAITNQPQSQRLVVGQVATFSVSATGSPAPKYQWRFNGGNIPGATASAYSRMNIQLNDAGSYSVQLTNSQGSVVSSNAVLTVTTNIVFTLTATAGSGGTVTSYPEQETYASNAVVVLTANANPGSAFTGWSGDASGTQNPLTITMVKNTSVGATFLTTNSGAEEMIVESRSGGLNFGSYTDSSFSDSTLKSGAPGCGDQALGSRYATATAATITITPGLQHAGGTYLLEVTHGSATSISKTITVKATLTGGSFAAPGGAAASVWTTAFRSPTANIWQPVGTFTLNPGVLQPTLRFTTTNTDLSGTSRFYSDAYRLTLQAAPPTIATAPASQSVAVGSSVTFAVSATGTAPLTYQWLRNGTNLSGARASSYSVINATPSDVGAYKVIVASLYGGVTSSNAVLTVFNPRPNILSLQLPSPGAQLTVTGGDPARNYVLETTSDFDSWDFLTNFPGTNGRVQFTDPATNSPRRFYRVKSTP
jgi:hypothetical protein